jgi:opacity protein-like surface antigen
MVDITLEFERRSGGYVAASRDILRDLSLRNAGFSKALAAAFALCVAPLACAQPAGPDNREWQFEAAPYIWSAGTDVSARIGASMPAANVNGSYSGAISSSTHAGVMGTFEAHRDRWSILFDLWRLKVSNESRPLLRGALGNASLETTQGVVELAGAYRVWDHQTTPVDAVAGLRYSHLKATINVSPSLLLPAGARFTDSVNWPDAFVGVRVKHALSNKWTLLGYADIGAGATKKSWQALAGADYAFSKNISAKFGYRIFSIDYEKSYFISDASTDFRFNMKTSGVYAGLGIKF